MGVQEEAPFGERSHDQVTLPLTSSGSLTAWRSAQIPTWGCSDDSVTVPGSSTLLTVMVIPMIGIAAACRVGGGYSYEVNQGSVS